MPSDVNGQVVSGFEAMTAGDWPGAHDALLAALAGGDVPEALLGLANGCYWLGDLRACLRGSSPEPGPGAGRCRAAQTRLSLASLLRQAAMPMRRLRCSGDSE